MHRHRLVFISALLFLAAINVAAQDTPKVEVAGQYSYVRTNPSTGGIDSFNLNGGGGSISANVNRWLGLVAEVNGYRIGKINGVNPKANLVSYLFGPRVTFRKEGVQPFVHALFGGAHVGSSLGLGSDNAFAMALGGGMDIKVAEHFSIRPAQVDYLMTRFDEGAGHHNQNNFPVFGGRGFHLRQTVNPAGRGVRRSCGRIPPTFVWKEGTHVG